MSDRTKSDSRARAFGGGRRHAARTLDDLLGRCRVDDETGCWIWAAGCSRQRGKTWTCDIPMAYVAAGVIDERRHLMSAHRAAWLLSGRSLHPGHVVWRHYCANDLCINPEHCRSGTRKQMHKAVAATGRNRGLAERAKVNMINRSAMMTPPHVVRHVEDLLRAGHPCKDVASIAGVSTCTVTSIRSGRHPYCAHGQPLVRGASVFALGAA